MLQQELSSYTNVVGLRTVYSLGFLAGISMTVQIVTGLCMVMYYERSVATAFDSVQLVARDMVFGWNVRWVHANMVSLMFMALYAHVWKNLVLAATASSKWTSWVLGFVLLAGSMGAAFTGYSLVYGQMSYWAIVVICNLATCVPYGIELLWLIWGGDSVGMHCLGRFLMLHFLLPLVLAAGMVAHLLSIHRSYSVLSVAQHVVPAYLGSFQYVCLLEDLALGAVLFVGLDLVIYLYPTLWLHPEYFQYANAFQTPHAIEPEWYLLAYYCILRAIPHKLTGLLGLVAGLVAFLAHASTVHASGSSGTTLSGLASITLLFLFIELMYLATVPVVYPYSSVTYVIVVMYFATVFAYA